MVGRKRQASAAVPPEMTQYSLYISLDGPHGWYGRVQKISPLPGLGPRTVQAAASSYTSCDILAHPETLKQTTMKPKRSVHWYSLASLSEGLWLESNQPDGGFPSLLTVSSSLLA